MNKKQIRYGIGFDVDASSLQKLKQELATLSQYRTDDLLKVDTSASVKSLSEFKSAISFVQDALDRSYDLKLNSTNLNTFNQILSQSKYDLSSLQAEFSKAGIQGQLAFKSLTTELLTTNTQLKKTWSLVDSLGQTLTNTIKWSIASGAINTVTGSIQKAWGYTQRLDSSLNDIRIVTEKSSDEMERFAKQANKAAKGLGAATTSYSNAALIYYQQGLGEADVKARTNVTVKAANVTGQSAAEVSEQLTAVWNGYKVVAEEAELYVDKLAAVAAKTAADLEELSDGMSKVASAANTMGVDVDQLSAQLATIVSVTRQDANVVGTALKTIYARMGDLKVSGVDEFGTSLGDVSGQMHQMGIEVLDQSGNLRDMGEVIEEVASKWKGWTDAQQQAAAVAIAGKRQYNNLIALFENWDMYESALTTSKTSAGTLQKQQEIYMDSLEARLQRLSTAGEKVYDALFDSESAKEFIDLLTFAVDRVGSFIEGIGGGGNALMALGSIAIYVLKDKIGQGITTALSNFTAMRENYQIIQSEMQFTAESLILADEKEKIGLREILKLKQDQLKYAKLITAEQKAQWDQQIHSLSVAQDEATIAKERVEILKKQKEETINFLDKQNISKRQQLRMGDIYSSEEIEALNQKEGKKYNSGSFSGKFSDVDLDNEISRNQILKEIRERRNFLSNEIWENSASILSNPEVSQKGKVEEIGLLAENFENDFLGDWKGDKESKGFTDLKEKYEQLKKVLTEYNEKLKEETVTEQDYINVLREKNKLEKAHLDFIEKEDANLAQHEKIVKTITEEEKKANKEQQKANNLLEKSEKDYISFSKQIKTEVLVSSFMKGAAAVGQFATSFQILTNLINIWKDEDLSFGEKLFQSFANGAMIIPMVVNGIQGMKAAIVALSPVKMAELAIEKKLTDENRKQVLIKVANASEDKKALVISALKTAGIKVEDEALEDLIKSLTAEQSLTAISTLLKDKNTTSTLANATASVIGGKAGLEAGKSIFAGGMLAQAGIWPVLLITLALAAAFAVLVGVIAAVTAVFKNIDWTTPVEKAKKEYEALTKAVNEFKESLVNVLESIQNVKQEIESYNKAYAAIGMLRKGTDSWKESVEKLKLQVLQLIEKYPALEKFVKESADGVTYIEQEGLDSLLLEKQNLVSSIEAASIYSKSQLLESENKLLTESDIYKLNEDGNLEVKDASITTALKTGWGAVWKSIKEPFADAKNAISGILSQPIDLSDLAGTFNEMADAAAEPFKDEIENLKVLGDSISYIIPDNIEKGLNVAGGIAAVNGTITALAAPTPSLSVAAGIGAGEAAVFMSYLTSNLTEVATDNLIGPFTEKAAGLLAENEDVYNGFIEELKKNSMFSEEQIKQIEENSKKIQENNEAIRKNTEAYLRSVVDQVDVKDKNAYVATAAAQDDSNIKEDIKEKEKEAEKNTKDEINRMLKNKSKSEQQTALETYLKSIYGENIVLTNWNQRDTNNYDDWAKDFSVDIEGIGTINANSIMAMTKNKAVEDFIITYNATLANAINSLENSSMAYLFSEANESRAFEGAKGAVTLNDLKQFKAGDTVTGTTTDAEGNVISKTYTVDQDKINTITRELTLSASKLKEVSGVSNADWMNSIISNLSVNEIDSFAGNMQRVSAQGGLATGAINQLLSTYFNNPEMIKKIIQNMGSVTDWSDGNQIQSFIEQLQTQGIEIDYANEAWKDYIDNIYNGNQQWIKDSQKVIDNLATIKNLTENLKMGDIISDEDYQKLLTIDPTIAEDFIRTEGGYAALKSGESISNKLKSRYGNLTEITSIYEGTNTYFKNNSAFNGKVDFKASNLTTDQLSNYIKSFANEDGTLDSNLARYLGVDSDIFKERYNTLITADKNSSEYAEAKLYMESIANRVNQAAIDAKEGRLTSKEAQEIWGTSIAGSWSDVEDAIENKKITDPTVKKELEQYWATNYLNELGVSEDFLKDDTNRMTKLQDLVIRTRKLELDYMKDINAQVELLGLEAENAFGKNKWDLLTNQKSLLLENRTQAAINLNDANANLVDIQAGTGLSGKTYQDLLDIIATEEEGSDVYKNAAAVIAAWDLVAEKEQEYYEAANAVIDKQLELVKDQYNTNKDFKDTLKEWSNTLLNYNRVKGSGLGMFSDASINESLTMAIANISVADYANDSIISTFINTLNNKGNYTDTVGAENAIINDSAWFEDTKEYAEDAIALIDEAIEKGSDLYGLYFEAYEEMLNLYDTEIEKRNTLNDLLKGSASLMKLIGRNAESSGLYNQVASYAQDSVELAKERAEMAMAEYNALTNSGTATPEMLGQAWEIAATAQEEFTSMAQEALDALYDAFSEKMNSAINAAFAEVNKRGYTGLSQEWELYKRQDELYLDDVNSAYALDKLERDIQKSIDSTDSLTAQKKLNELKEEQLKMLQEQDKLSQYDFDRANAMYDLTLKQIALEEAQQTMNKMKLVRDANGNYTYQYVADQDLIAEKQAELAEAENNLYNLQKDHQKELVDSVFSLTQEWAEARKEAAAMGEEQMKIVDAQYRSMLDALQEDLGLVGDELTTPFSDMFNQLQDFDFEEFKQNMEEAWSGGEDSILSNYNSIMATVGEFVDGISTVTDALKNNLKADEIKDAAGTLSDSMGKALTTMQTLSNTISSMITTMEPAINKYLEIYGSALDIELANNTEAVKNATIAIYQAADKLDNNSADGSIDAPEGYKWQDGDNNNKILVDLNK